MSRKDILRTPNLIAADALPSERPAAKTRILPLLGTTLGEGGAEPTTSRLTSQVGGAFAEGKARFERAEEIEKRLAAGQAVIDMDPASIDPSFVQDRMPGDIDGLVASIRDQGQQVPILVRPHPEQSGRYQVAFGHRRLRAIQELGRQVKAIVRDLTDEQLVVAQGQENNERQDLTFIERALFAARLKDRFPRETIMASLSVGKSEISIMLSIAAAVPDQLITAIGPAPGIGRRSWQEVADLLDKRNEVDEVIAFISDDAQQALTSEERFKALSIHLKPARAIKGVPAVWTARSGQRLAQVSHTKTKLDISIDKRAAPEFAAFVLEHLQSLFEAHCAKK